MSQAHLVDGRIVRDGGNMSQFSFPRFLLVSLIASLMIITNPANELRDAVECVVAAVEERLGGQTQKRDLSEWQWSKMLDPPISVTNFGIFTVEERHAKVDFLALTTSWSCPYFDERMGSFCSTLARNLCHQKPLLYDPKDYAYTTHRVICFLLILSSLLSFCYGGYYPASWATDPLIGALLKTFGRAQFSPVSLALDLFNASMSVYPALVRMQTIVPTLQGGGVASDLGLPACVDFIFYACVLVVFCGGGANAIASQFGRRTTLGFDSTVAAAAGYSTAFSASPGQGVFMSPQTVLWGYLPVMAVLGGSSLAWILGGMMGVALGQYHIDNINFMKALKQTVLSAF